MFTGIVTDLATVRAIVPEGAGRDRRFEIATAFDMAGISIGASIACSGPCLTVIEKGPGWFAVEASAETLARTTLGDWRIGTRINLERSLAMGDELGGHIVTGHVDGVGTVLGICPEGDSRRIGFAVSGDLAPYLAPKGSITIDGVSLTVNEVADEPDGSCRFGINIIPHTLTHTTLGDRKPGDRGNLEVDLFARYVALLMEQRR